MKELEDLFEKETKYIVSTEKGCAIHGDATTLLSLYAMMSRELLKLDVIDKQDLEKAINLAVMTNEELSEELKNQIYSFLDGLKNIKNEKTE